jgi:hypothetical protein
MAMDSEVGLIRTQKRWTARLLLLLSSTLLCLVLLELALRVIMPQIGWTQREDPLLGWSSREYQEFNPQADVATQRKRILFIGDSFLAGSGVTSLDHRFPVLLRRRLGNACDVAILASGAWGTDQELLAYEQKGVAWRPDIVVVAFTASNDLKNILSNYGGSRMPKPYFVYSEGAGLTLHSSDGHLAAQSGHDALREFPIPDPLWKRSLLLRLVALKIHRLASREQYDPAAFPLVDERYKHFTYREQQYEEIIEKQEHLTWSPQMGANDVMAYIKENFRFNTYGWQLLDQILARLRGEVERDHGQLVLMLLPVAFNLRDPDTIVGGPFTKQLATPEGPFTFRSAEPRDRLPEICARRNITFFDPTKEFRTYVTRNSQMKEFWPNPKDGHFSDRAHEYLAEICVKWFSSLLSQDASPPNNRPPSLK